MPYTTEMEFGVVEDHIQDFAGRIGISLSPLIVGDEGTLEFKARSIDCYRSQVVTEERRGILNYARWLNENGAERLWEVEFGGSLLTGSRGLRVCFRGGDRFRDKGVRATPQM